MLNILVATLLSLAPFSTSLSQTNQEPNEVSSCGITQETLDQVTAESGGYEITVDEYCAL